jgi:hypothetical protein
MQTTIFWYNDPAILINKNHVEFWPLPTMTFESKLNAITRLVILLSILGFILSSFSFKYIIIGLITLIVINLIYFLKKQKNIPPFLKKQKEGFDNIENEIDPVTLKSVLKRDFYSSSDKNPFGNVLLTEINDEPKRLAAPPSFNLDVSEDITKNIKKMVQDLNPTIKNTDKQLFGDLYQNFELDQSNRVFFSNANTRVTNDQGAFANFLYGGMISAKEGNPLALLQDNYRYILI